MDFRGSNGFTLQEALDILFEADDEYQARVQEIYIEPPEVNILTDEDSGDEDGAGAMDNLTGRQLLAPAELRLENNDRIGAFNTLGNPPPPTKVIDQSPSVSTDVDKFIIQNEQWVRNRQKPIPEWITGDFDDRVQHFPTPNYNHLSNMTIIELFLTDEIINLLVDETRNYTLFKNCNDQNITCDEIRCFIGILLLSGYDQVPSKRHYWEQDQDVQNLLVSNSMRRDRFF